MGSTPMHKEHVRKALDTSFGRFQSNRIHYLLAPMVLFVLLTGIAQSIDSPPVEGAPGQHSSVHLNEEEKAWIAENPIVNVGVFQMPPYQFMEDGVPAGYQVEMMEAMLKTVGLEPRYLRVALPETLKEVREDRLDIVLNMIHTSERADSILFSDSSLDLIMGIFGDADRKDISDFDSLQGKTMASYHGYVLEDKLTEVFPYSPLVRADDTLGMLRLVALGEADFCIQETSSGKYWLHKGFITNVEAKGILAPTQLPLLSAHEFGVRKDLPLLKSILDKADGAMDSAQSQRIWHRWFISEPAKEEGLPIALTEEEEQWLHDHPVIRVSNEMDWPPYDFVKDGEPQGYSVDYVRLIAHKLGIQIEFVNGYSWNELVDLFCAKEIDLLHPADKPSKLKVTGIFTDAIIREKLTILSRRRLQDNKQHGRSCRCHGRTPAGMADDGNDTSKI